VTFGLESGATDRLERFADLIAGVERASLPAYAVELVPDGRLQAALDRANVELQVESRRSALRAEIDRFIDIVRRGFRTDVKLRVEIARGLERAVAAVALWDHLDSETRLVLAGPWADLAEAAAE
jgi:hypothetical protein